MFPSSEIYSGIKPNQNKKCIILQFTNSYMWWLYEFSFLGFFSLIKKKKVQLSSPLPILQGILND